MFEALQPGSRLDAPYLLLDAVNRQAEAVLDQ